MNTAIVMLGSNINQDENLTIAKEKLSLYFELVHESTMLITKPIGEKYKNMFHNQALKMHTVEKSNEMIRLFKTFEIEMGRDDIARQNGIVPIDIDLIVWNDEIISDDYAKYPFVRESVDEIKDNVMLDI